jgi:hypothetical protein
MVLGGNQAAGDTDMMIEDTAGEAYVRTLVFGKEVEMPESVYHTQHSPAAIRRRLFAFFGLPAPVEEGRGLAAA